jgi:hypothetical protein
MSNDLAADWLLHGVAAAQAGEKEGARGLLGHALVELDVVAEVYGANDTDAREKAWYWLSQIADDPKQKRDYLENVLASNTPIRRRCASWRSWTAASNQKRSSTPTSSTRR